MKKWIVMSGDESSKEVREFGTEEEALKHARSVWDHWTAEEKERKTISAGLADEQLNLEKDLHFMDLMKHEALMNEIERLKGEFRWPEYYFDPREMKHIEPRMHQPEGTRVIGYEIMDPEEYCQASGMQDTGDIDEDTLVIWVVKE